MQFYGEIILKTSFLFAGFDCILIKNKSNGKNFVKIKLV
jgi:hypothetical protein